LVTALAVALVFTTLARVTRGVTASGAVAGAVVCFLIFTGSGPAAGLVLLCVFCLTWLATRYGYQRKQTLGTAEPREGRKASQVLANLGVAAICAASFRLSRGNAVWLLAMSAALAEAAADTVSSELGQTSKRGPRLITTWDHVPAGTDGGISRRGTAGGLMAAAVVCVVCVLAGLLPSKRSYISLGAATFGMLADSVLGASLERRKLLNNDAVNFASTAVAAGVAAWLSHLIA
jgi:uncharacterized protein (TIGR00297 family)